MTRLVAAGVSLTGNQSDGDAFLFLPKSVKYGDDGAVRGEYSKGDAGYGGGGNYGSNQ